MKEIFLIFYDLFFCIFIILYEILKSSWQFVIQFIKPNYKSLRGEIVLLTGAANGIGREMCINLAEKGCIVLGVDVDTNGLIETKDIVYKKTDKNMFIYSCDIRFKENILKLHKYVEDNIGHVDILINNAGILHGKQILDLTEDEIKETFDVNLFANFYIVQSFLPQMLKRSHGHIVFVSSVGAYVTTPFLSDYCASKASLSIFGETLLTELRYVHKNDDIHVTIVTPFLVESGLLHGCLSRLSWLLPALKPSYVANKIIKGIMKNQIQLSMGRLTYFIFVIKSILPVNAIFELYKFSGGITILNTFKNIRLEARLKNYEKLNNCDTHQ